MIGNIDPIRIQIEEIFVKKTVYMETVLKLGACAIVDGQAPIVMKVCTNLFALLLINFYHIVHTGACATECRNGGVCIGDNSCSCPRGWTGSTCEQAQCTISCIHGRCITSPTECVCDAGWGGANCNQGLRRENWWLCHMSFMWNSHTFHHNKIIFLLLCSCL